MRTRLALALLAGLAAGSAAFAQDGKPAAQDPATAQAPAAAPAQAPAAEPPAQAAPKAIPVPNLPVVEKRELAGGLIVEDMTIGTGYEIKPGDSVVAFYHGTLKDTGTVFDSAFERGEPIAFPLGGVIQGWQQGVPGMKVGGIRKLTIPYALAYGEQGRPPAIPAKADLVFVIQLVDALQVEDIKPGEGEPASGQCVAVTAHRIIGADGKEIEKHDASNPYIWFPGESQAVSSGLTGMKKGGKRKITVPAQMNIANPGLPSSRPSNVPVTIEVELLAVRNLPGR